MDIKIISSGKVFYQVDPTLCAILLELFPANVERANPLPKPPASFEVKWSVEMDNGGYYYALFQQNSRNERYFGPPSQLVSFFQKMSIVVPDHILKQYAPLWRPHAPIHPAVQAAWLAEYNAIHGLENQ
jgi:hypothetical protein